MKKHTYLDLNIGDIEEYAMVINNPIDLLDDNYLTLDENGNYLIFNRGKKYGFSSEENVTFFSNKLKQGRYKFQAIVETRSGEKIYSNIIDVQLPIKKIKNA